VRLDPTQPWVPLSSFSVSGNGAYPNISGSKWSLGL
jgi:hypothetical protein